MRRTLFSQFLFRNDCKNTNNFGKFQYGLCILHYQIFYFIYPLLVSTPHIKIVICTQVLNKELCLNKLAFIHICMDTNIKSCEVYVDWERQCEEKVLHIAARSDIAHDCYIELCAKCVTFGIYASTALLIFSCNFLPKDEPVSRLNLTFVRVFPQIYLQSHSPRF